MRLLRFEFIHELFGALFDGLLDHLFELSLLLLEILDLFLEGFIFCLINFVFFLRCLLFRLGTVRAHVIIRRTLTLSRLLDRSISNLILISLYWSDDKL